MILVRGVWYNMLPDSHCGQKRGDGGG